MHRGVPQLCLEKAEIEHETLCVQKHWLYHGAMALLQMLAAPALLLLFCDTASLSTFFLILCLFLPGSQNKHFFLSPSCLLFPVAELEFVQIIIIVVVMMVMVVVITCLLNHYKLSARSFINRHSQGRRREENLSSVSTPCLPPRTHSCFSAWFMLFAVLTS